MSRGKRRRTRIDGQFAAREIKMLESPSFRVLSLSARRVLDRLEIELAHHGGMDNGRLPVTYGDFVRYGIDRHAIAPAIRELVALGFVEVTVRGHAGNAEWRTPNCFRITYKHTKEAEPTHEWKRVYTIEQAERIAREARSFKRVRKPAVKNKTPMGQNIHSCVESPHLEPVHESPTTGSGEEPTLLSISRGWGAGAGGLAQQLVDSDESER
jgi:hypothetical protein